MIKTASARTNFKGILHLLPSRALPGLAGGSFLVAKVIINHKSVGRRGVATAVTSIRLGCVWPAAQPVLSVGRSIMIFRVRVGQLKQTLRLTPRH